MIEKQKPGHLLESPCIALETLLKVSGSSVYALVHRSKSMVQVFGSTNTVKHLGGILEEIKTSGEYRNLLEDVSEIDFVILETNVLKEDLRICIANWISKYKKKGYTMYKEISDSRLVLETRIEFYAGKPKYYLYAVGTGSYEKLLGIFKWKKDLKEFMNANYEGDRISTLVVHSSASTCRK